MFVDSVQRCATALRLLLFLLLLQILILGGLVFHLERGPSVVDGMWRNDDGITPSTFQSIPEAAWWCLVTVTTVGYGDLVPSTVLGKLVASVAMLTGLLLMAAIISIVGQQGQSAVFAVPQLGSCASSGRARRLWLAWHSQGEAQPLGAQPMPRVLERAASKVAESTAFDPSGGQRDERPPPARDLLDGSPRGDGRRRLPRAHAAHQRRLASTCLGARHDGARTPVRATGGRAAGCATPVRRGTGRRVAHAGGAPARDAGARPPRLACERGGLPAGAAARHSK